MSVQVTPLRQRMIDDMAIRNMSPLTQKAFAEPFFDVLSINVR